MALPDGIRLAVRLKPRSARNGVEGVMPDEAGRLLLVLRVTAPPIEGAANDALISLLADALRVRRSAIHIVAGETARIKQVMLEGDPAALVLSLRRWIMG